MKSMEEIVCQYCHNRIMSFGLPCYQLLRKILNAYSNDHIYHYNSESFDSYLGPSAFLERKGYIITTESSLKHIACIPSDEPWEYENGEFGFCWCRKEFKCK